MEHQQIVLPVVFKTLLSSLFQIKFSLLSEELRLSHSASLIFNLSLIALVRIICPCQRLFLTKEPKGLNSWSLFSHVYP